MADFSFDFAPAAAAERVAERPFYLGILADLSGGQSGGADQQFLVFDVDNVDDRMRAAAPQVAFEVANVVVGEGTLDVGLTFSELDDFGPGRVASQVPLLAALCEARTKLAAMRSRPPADLAKGVPEVHRLLTQVLPDPVLVDALAGTPAPEPEAEEPEPAEAGLSDFERLLGGKTGHEAAAPSSPLRGLFEQATAGTPQISDQASQTLALLLDRIDELVGKQLDAILHHDDFRRLEATWRGLHFVLESADTDDGLSIRVLNVSKAGLAAMLEAGDLLGVDPLTREMRGEPYGALAGDFYFDHCADDVALLGRLGRVVTALGVPFVGGAAAGLFGLATWRDLPPSLDVAATLEGDAYAGWRELVESPAAARLMLAMPRFLARLPYGPKTNPAEGIAYAERAAVDDPGAFVWCNAAWAMAAVIANAVSFDGWGAAITAGGEDCMVDGLPVYAFTDRHGDSAMMCPTELPMTVELGALLAKAGLAPLVHLKNTDRAVFIRTPSLGRGA